MISLIKLQVPLSWSHWSSHTSCLSLRSFYSWSHWSNHINCLSHEVFSNEHNIQKFSFFEIRSWNPFVLPHQSTRTILHLIHYNINGGNRGLTTSNHCLKNSWILLQETKINIFFKNTKNLLQAFTLRTKNLAEFPLFKEFHGSLVILYTQFKKKNPSSTHLSL